MRRHFILASSAIC
ncbi:hypothetical protein Zm00014a_016730 [Zea mays]|uniref:Uncharacterized protein n=1 Tax=Zea mays TaxID=4577 RepID=A0A3L6E185_MAIZE|nr:hypothetical protein Zm00014a_016730 [Zea mays]